MPCFSFEFYDLVSYEKAWQFKGALLSSAEICYFIVAVLPQLSLTTTLTMIYLSQTYCLKASTKILNLLIDILSSVIWGSKGFPLNTCWKEKEGKHFKLLKKLLGFRTRKNIVFLFISHLSYNEKFSQGLSVSCHEMRIFNWRQIMEMRLIGWLEMKLLS